MPIIYDRKTELRRDYFLDNYVIISPGRSRRPRDVMESTHRAPGQKCVLCPEQLERDLVVDTIGGKINWRVLSALNKYPALTLDNPKAYGVQEVIIETRQHGYELGDMNLKEISDVLKMYQKRTHAISRIKEIEYILIFKNNGGPAGASLLHAHSQVFASKKTPPEVFYELDKAQEYKIRHGRNVYEDIIKKETTSSRFVWKDKYTVIFCPYASRYHYEAWIFPRRKVDNITGLKKPELASLAKGLQLVLSRLNQYHIPYNFFMHQCIPDRDQYFYIKIQPRESIWAGVELGSGIVINSVSPETAARFYKKKTP